MDRHAYLHGFGSGPGSAKGVELARRYAELGLKLELPNLNRPAFPKLSYTSVLAYLQDDFAPHGPINLIGSSMGGHVSARWAQLCPKTVNKIVLLCPGFDLAGRWPDLMGARAFKAWSIDGYANFEDQAGDVVPLHYDFLEDARTHPAYPVFEHPTVIVHGREDDIVPIASSRKVAQELANVELVEVDDDHSLASSLDVIWDVIVRHFGLSR